MVIFDEDVWCDWNYSGQYFEFVCPRCKRPSLVEEENSTIRKPTGGNLEWIDLGFLECIERSCASRVAFCYTVTKKRKSSKQEKVVPLFFEPPLPIFTGQVANLPYCVMDHEPIISRLFWIDPSSCGNAIRRFLEALLSEMGVRTKKKLQNGKFHVLSLHERIKEFSQGHPRHGRWLESVKWVGNIGSHELDLDLAQVTTCLKVIRSVLEEFFHSNEEAAELESWSRDINRRRRP